MTSRLRKSLYVLATIAGVAAIWYLGAWLVQLGDDPLASSKLPYPHAIAELLVDEREALLDASWISLRQALVGFAIGAAVGVILSVVMAQGAWLEAGIVPFILAAQMVPMIALVPIVQNIFRNDDVTRVFISGFITFFSVTIAVVRGLKAAPPPAFELMASYNAGRLRTLRFLQMPAAVPMLFTGLRIAAPLSLVGSVLVDLTGAQSGLGYVMLAALTVGGSGSMILWGAMLILLALGYLLSQSVAAAERVLAPWQVGLRTEGA